MPLSGFRQASFKGSDYCGKNHVCTLSSYPLNV